MSTNAQLTGQVVKEYLKKFPNTKSLTLSRIIYKENPELFKNVEAVRTQVRYYRGAKGATARKNVSTKEHFRMTDTHNPFNLPEPREDRQVLPFVFPKNLRNTLIISDIHLPYHDLEPINVAFEYAIKHNVDSIIFNGDTFDFYALSRYQKDPRIRDLAVEIQIGKEFLQETDKIFPRDKVKKYFKIGNHECFSEDTEILTQDGWMDYRELTSRSLVATYNIDNDQIEYQHPTKIHEYDFDGELVHIANKFSDLLITDNHRLLYRRTDFNYPCNLDIRPYDELPLSRIGIPVAGRINENDKVLLSDDEIRMSAWYIAEGYYSNKNSLTIYQSENKVSHITDTLDRLGWQYSTYQRDRNVTQICGTTLKSQPQTQYTIRVSNHDNKRLLDLVPDKYSLPGWVYYLDDRQFDIFLETYVLADGTMPTGAVDSRVVYSSDPDFVDKFQHACITHNHCTTITEYREGEYRLNIVKNRPERVYDKGIRHYAENVPYKGKVWCVTTPNDTVVVRRKGKPAITGNSRWEAYLYNKAPELIGSEVFEIENVFEFEAFGFEKIGDRQEIHVGENLTVLHGHEFTYSAYSPVNPARGFYNRFKENVIGGHLHRSSQHTERTGRNRIKSSWSLGCNCYSDDTEVLTQDGFKKFSDVTLNDRVGQYNKQTKSMSLVTPTAFQVFDYNGDMVNFTSNRLDLLITPDHRVLYYSSEPLYERVDTASHVYNLTKGKIPIAGHFESEVEYDAVTAQILGWIICDGSLEKAGNSRRIRIYQKKEPNVTNIRKLLNEANLYFSEYVDKRSGVIIFTLHADSSKKILGYFDNEEIKRIPRDLLNASYEVLQLLYETLIAADGHRTKKNQDYFASLSKDLADDFAELCCKIGYSSRNVIQRPAGSKLVPNGPHRKAIYRCRVRKFARSGIKEKTITKYRGKVYCASVPSGFLVVKRNGKIAICGNCLLRPEYATLNNWNHGFAHLTRESENHFHIKNYMVINGKLHSS